MIKIKSFVAVAAAALMVCFGSTIVYAQDSSSKIKNNSRELFLMKHEPQGWRIYRYIFNEGEYRK